MGVVRPHRGPHESEVVQDPLLGLRQRGYGSTGQSLLKVEIHCPLGLEPSLEVGKGHWYLLGLVSYELVLLPPESVSRMSGVPKLWMVLVPHQEVLHSCRVCDVILV